MANNFLLNTKAEFLKCRHSAALWLTVLAAAFLPAINGIILIEKPAFFISKFKDEPWLALLRMNWKNGATVILPMYVILINNVIAQVEFKNNTWKQVYALPRRYADIFFSKFIVVQTYLFAFFICFQLFIILSGYTVSLFQKDYFFNAHSIPAMEILIIITRLYVTILGVSAVQFWLSTRFRNFIVPLGVGIGLWITGLVLMDWDKIVYYPYMYSALMAFIEAPKHIGTLSLLYTNAIIFFLVALSLGFWNIYALKERG